MELEAMTRYTSPVNPAVFPHLTVVLLAIGMFFTAWFFVYEVTSTKYTRDVYKELLISLVASLFMGFDSCDLTDSSTTHSIERKDITNNMDSI
uniref:Dolichyl-diphosphooligosaccharide-protein glycosyltransferase subunit TMEM258 n=1 Tax=Gasterosteus aculeatus aculeatus TaxID=481459 RepID=A0AAQ4PBS8_GASAC